MSRTISTALRHRSKSRVCSKLESSFFGGFMDALCSSFGWDIAQLSQNSTVSGYRIPRQKARDLSESAKRFVRSCNMNGSLQASSPSGSCPSIIRVRRSLDQGLRSSAWNAKQWADRHQRTEYKFWVVQQATLSPPKSFRDSQRTPAALNRAVARACRPPDNKLHTTSYRRRIAPCAPVSARNIGTVKFYRHEYR